MVRLVKKTVNKLTDEQRGQLHSLVENAEKRDRDYFTTLTKLRQLLEGDHWPAELAKNGTKLTINQVHSYIRTQLPTLYFQDPYVQALPLLPNQEASADTWENVINRVLERTDYKDQTKQVVLDALLFPEGWKKWLFNFAATDDDVEAGTSVLDPEARAQSLNEVNSVSPRSWDDINVPVGVRLSPTQIITDAVTRDPKDCRFIAVRYNKLLSELIADDRYPGITESIKENYSPDSANNRDVFNRAEETNEGELEKIYIDDTEVTLYEIWVYQLVDLKLYKQVVYMLKEHPRLHIRDIEHWQEYLGTHVKTYPFTKLVYNPIPDAKPKSGIETWRNLQEALNWVTSRIVGMIENQQQIVEVDTSALQDVDKALRQLQSGRTREFVKVNGNSAGKPALMPVETAPVPSDNYQLVPLLMSMLQQVSGQGQNRRGSGGIRTATEASIIENTAQIRDDEAVDVTGDFLKKDMDILVRMLRYIGTNDFVFRLTNDTGGIKWGKFTPFEAGWSPDIKIKPFSFSRAAKQERSVALQQVITLGAQLLPLYGQDRINILAAFKDWMDELDLPGAEKIISEGIDDTVKQMLEILSMAVTGQAVKVRPEENHQAEAAAVDQVLNSGIFDHAPQLAEIVMQHGEQHKQLAQELSANAPNAAPSSPSGLLTQQSTNGTGPAPNNDVFGLNNGST